ncbi:hypothetical protein [Vagococcus sp.]|uniref:hypothetical protein n=1 Tax=Vagococcus sp. TaxID=1933889 RepID=UPI003F9728B4
MLALSQEFTLLAFKENQRVSYDPNLRLSLVTAALLDLLFDDVIIFDNKKVKVIQKLSGRLLFLAPLYEVLAKKETIKLTKISELYSYKNKEFKDLFGHLEESVHSIPDQEGYRKIVIERLKEQIERNELDIQSVMLLTFLNKNRKLKNYFTRDESEIIKIILKQVKENEGNQALITMVNNIEAVTVAMMSSAIFI